MKRRLYDQFPALCRFALGGNALVAWATSISDSRSYLAFVAQSHDSKILLSLMALSGAMIVFDVVINDWTPAHFYFAGHRFQLRWRRAFECRHYLFTMLAFCYAAQPYVIARTSTVAPLWLFFYWHALLNLTAAFLDAKQRAREELKRVS